jgi:hypothetical protein
MRKAFSALAFTFLFVAGTAHALPSEVPVSSDGFNFPLVNPQHDNMQRLLINAMGYLKPEHGLVDPASGYPVEGWNQEPDKGLYLRSFTQLTAIGERLELLANIAAGFAQNPYVSRAEALSQLKLMLASLLVDQHDPDVGARGLLGNFLGFEGHGRIGPLGEEVEKVKFVEAFGEQQASQIWAALVARGWLLPQQDGSFAKTLRKTEYGDSFFTGALAPFAETNTRAKIMALLDTRVVQIVFGDNANLTASAAKAIGALLHSSLQDDPVAVELRDKLEQFIAGQQEGYRQLYDEESGLFYFGWNATQDRYTGWEDDSGNWVVGHMDYLVNEFRGPLQFVVQRFGLPIDAIKNSGFKIKPYRMPGGDDVYTLATWNGSAFESMGLSLFMQEMQLRGWRENLENSVEIELDFSGQHNLPGFLSEAYSGNGVEYTGNIGIPAIAVNERPRITDAPSLYMLGTAYSIAPDSIERFLGDNWKQIEVLLTDHGPWEGYNTTQHTAIKFQTTAHTLALILGGISSADINMYRYLTWQGLASVSKPQSGESLAYNFLDSGVKWIPWSSTGDALDATRLLDAIRIQAPALRNGAVTVTLPQTRGVSLSNGALLIRYHAARPLDVVMTLAGSPKVFQNEIFTRFDATDTEKEIRIPMPATPGLEDVAELVIRFGNEHAPVSVDLTITGLEFVPAR